MTALVTGAAGGIGLAIAERLLEDGAKVFMTDIDADRLAAAAEAIAPQSPDVAIMPADLARREQRDRLVPALIERSGRLDSLVNNAAFHGARTPFLDADESEFEQIIAVNVLAATSLCRA